MSLLNTIYRKQFEKKRKCNNVSEIPCKKARKKNPPLKDSHEIILEKVVDGGEIIKEKSFEVEVKNNYAIIYLNKDVKIIEKTTHNGYNCEGHLEEQSLNQINASVINFYQDGFIGRRCSMGRSDIWYRPWKIIRINHEHNEKPVFIGRLKNRSRLTGDGTLKSRYRNYNAFWYFESDYNLARKGFHPINVISGKKELKISFKDDKNTHIVSENIIIKDN